MALEYKTLYINDNGTAKVQMTINGHILEQDIPTGEDQESFNTNVKSAMAVFKAELKANAPPEFEPELDTSITVLVSDLPEIESE